MAENLKVTHYNNGDEITTFNIDYDSFWSSWLPLTTGATLVYSDSWYGKLILHQVFLYLWLSQSLYFSLSNAS